MIFDALASFIVGTINFVFGFGEVVASEGFPASVDAFVNQAASIMHIFDAIIPTYALFDVIFLVILPIEAAIFAYWASMIVIKIIRGF